MSIRIGTSGWNYPEWAGNFYAGKKNWLQHYASFFDTVELNNSFYKLPEIQALIKWRETVPDDFIFSVKASRFITHMKKLIGAPENFVKFFDRIVYLEEKTGPVLFQLPPRWKCNLERLEQFIKALPAHYRYVFEFRDHSWYNENVYALLRAHNCAFCIYQLLDHLSPLIYTSNLVYIRLHGREKDYYGDYSEEELRFWANQIIGWKGQNLDVYVYFDNTRGNAWQNARRLKELLGLTDASVQ